MIDRYRKSKAQVRAELADVERMIRAGKVTITHEIEGRYVRSEHGLGRSRGGTLPDHLDPRQMGLTREELEAQLRLQSEAMLAPDARVSRRQRVHGARCVS